MVKKELGMKVLGAVMSASMMLSSICAPVMAAETETAPDTAVETVVTEETAETQDEAAAPGENAEAEDQVQEDQAEAETQKETVPEKDTGENKKAADEETTQENAQETAAEEESDEEEIVVQTEDVELEEGKEAAEAVNIPVPNPTPDNGTFMGLETIPSYAIFSNPKAIDLKQSSGEKYYEMIVGSIETATVKDSNGNEAGVIDLDPYAAGIGTMDGKELKKTNIKRITSANMAKTLYYGTYDTGWIDSLLKSRGFSSSQIKNMRKVLMTYALSYYAKSNNLLYNSQFADYIDAVDDFGYNAFWKCSSPSLREDVKKFINKMNSSSAPKGYTAYIVYPGSDKNVNGVSAYAYIVKDRPQVAVTKVSLDKTNASMKKGNTVTLKASVAPSNATNKALKWESSNTKVATVSQTGAVKAVGAGKAVITCTSKTNSSAKATCQVTVTAPVQKITLNKTSASVNKGGKLTLKQTVVPSDASNKAVVWKSSNTKVATVSQTGVVTAVAKGTATITCTSKENAKISASCKVTVKIPVTGVKLNKTSASVKKGSTITLTATVSPASASNKAVTWTSNNTKIATVSAGKVKGIKAGKAVITCTTKDGKKIAKCTITVK